MLTFDEYIRQGEPNRSDKAKVWKTAIGLQQVDGLTPSDYLIETANRNIVGEISLEEVKNRIDSYYLQHPIQANKDRTEEADKVSARIAEIISEQTFTFSPAEYLSIHRRLFQGIYPFAGKIRNYNITKSEWVLDGETVLYGSADSLKATLEFDFAQEKKFSYQGLNETETLEHLARFFSNLWQIHVFGEGNTRTTAIFLIKYLRSFGFRVHNTLFEEHSWYFRNALVRANYRDVRKNIHPTNVFLLKFFANLLLGENYSLKNRELHVNFASHEIDSRDKKPKIPVTYPRNSGRKIKGSEKNLKSSEKVLNDSEKNLKSSEKNPRSSEKNLKSSGKKPNSSGKTLNISENNPNSSEKNSKGSEKKLNSSEKNSKGSEKKLNSSEKNSKGSEKKLNSSEKRSIRSEKSSEKILRIITANVHITIKELADQLGITTRAIEKNIAKLKARNKLERIGGDKGGQWRIK